MTILFLGRLVTTGQAAHLYHHDPAIFSALGPEDAWQQAADEGGFEGFLHPYVQTPLWAYGLQPLCRRTDFAGFKHVLEWMEMLSFAGCLWLAARYWAPLFLSPLPMAVVVAGLWFSEPFVYAMALMQTHILLLLLTVAALILAERDRPVEAGLLLACAAAVKITPGALLLYWILTGRRRAAVSLVGWSVVLAAAAVLATGPAVFAAYLADLHRVSRVLLVAMNNQSLAAWAMARFYPVKEIGQFSILPLPAGVRFLSMALMVAGTVAGGMMDRHRRVGTGPLGAMVALVAATVFAPIAWTHYFVLLAMPLMVVVEESGRMAAAWRRCAAWAGVAVVAALNFQPLAVNIRESTPGQVALVRSEFYAGLGAMALLGLVWWWRKRSEGAPAMLA